MKAVITLSPDGTKRTIEAETGTVLSAVLNRCGIHIDMSCGGRGICKRCMVYINGEKRLACRTKIGHDMHVDIERPADIKNIATGNEAAILPRDPMYSRYGVSIDIGTTTVCVSLLDASGTTQTI